MPNIAFVRPELQKLLPLYDVISDCLEGETFIKKKKSKYLPVPNASDVSRENQERYAAYVMRAVFYNVTKRTLRGLSGFVFLRDPAIEVPEAMKPVVEDATGAGVPLAQVAKAAVSYVLSFGRAGLWVDFPDTRKPKSPIVGNGAEELEDGAVTVADLASGEIHPTLTVYDPRKIINWRTKKRGARHVLSLVVLEEEREIDVDGFEMKKETQWRVLRLVEGANGKDAYHVEIWRSTANRIFQQVSNVPVIGANGQPLEDILFTFIGVDNNDSIPDQPPLYDLASLNIAHYRNSADYEESCFLVGQPTPVFAGLTKDWVETVMKGTAALGSRGGIPLPAGGTAELLQAAPNSQPFEAMEHKERQMVALGAKLVENKEVQRTATEADQDNASETSVLASAAKNVSSAFVDALNWAAVDLMGVSGECKFQVHSDLGLSRMSAEERQQLVAEWQGGAITFEEMRDALRQAGIATEDDAKAKEQISKDQTEAMQLLTDASVPDKAPPEDPNKNPGNKE